MPLVEWRRAALTDLLVLTATVLPPLMFVLMLLRMQPSALVFLAVVAVALLISILGGGILASIRPSRAWWAASLFSLCSTPFWAFIWFLSGVS